MIVAYVNFSVNNCDENSVNSRFVVVYDDCVVAAIALIYKLWGPAHGSAMLG